MDFIVDLPESDNMTGIFVVVDWLTKYAIFTPFKRATAEDTANMFFTHVIANHGIPNNIISDWGTHLIQVLAVPNEGITC